MADKKEALFLVTLEFSTENFGGASMTLQLAVDPAHQTLNGRADGTVDEGTETPMNFTAEASGTYKYTGLGNVTIVGEVAGQGALSATPPAIGTYLAPFSANFAVDSDWNGTGSFMIGQHSYESCAVKSVEALVPA